MKVRKLLMLLVVLSMVVCLTACGKEEEVKGVLQIQSIENISLDEDTELPYEMKYHDTAADAYNEPLPIYVHDKGGEEAHLSFSFTDERFSVDEVVKGIIIEKDEEYDGTSWISQVGDIQTFSLKISYVKEVCTIVYSIDFYDSEDQEKRYKRRYIAFRITPESETE